MRSAAHSDVMSTGRCNLMSAGVVSSVGGMIYPWSGRSDQAARFGGVIPGYRRDGWLSAGPLTGRVLRKSDGGVRVLCYARLPHTPRLHAWRDEQRRDDTLIKTETVSDPTRPPYSDNTGRKPKQDVHCLIKLIRLSLFPIAPNPGASDVKCKGGSRVLLCFKVTHRCILSPGLSVPQRPV